MKDGSIAVNAMAAFCGFRTACMYTHGMSMTLTNITRGISEFKMSGVCTPLLSGLLLLVLTQRRTLGDASHQDEACTHTHGMYRSFTDIPCEFSNLLSTALLIGVHLGGGEPPGKAAEVPLAADVGAGAQQHIEAQLLRDVEEALDVRLAVPFEGARAALVEVPGHIQLRNKCCI